MNSCNFMGNLVRDCELKTVGDTQVANFTIAVNRKYKNKAGEIVNQPAFLDMVAWGNQGVAIHQYIKKGDAIAVSAEAETQTWETEEGQKRSKIRFRVDKFTFVPRRSQSADTNTSSQTGEVPY